MASTTEMSQSQLREMLELIEEKDDLLRDVSERLRRERSGEAVDWFKHGDHGSHNNTVPADDA